MKRGYHISPKDEAAELIECYIMLNKLVPHDQLPSERDLCGMWNVSRSTLRAASDRLVMEGRLYRLHGSGTYVAPPKVMRNLQDTKSTSEALLSAGRTLRTAELNKCIVECNKSVAQKLHLLLGAKALLLRRLRLIDDEPAMIEVSYISHERFPWADKHDFAEKSLYEALRESGAHIEGGRETIGITYANPEEAELLGIAENAPLFFLSGVAFGSGGEPIEYFETVARSDKLRFKSTLIRTEG